MAASGAAPAGDACGSAAAAAAEPAPKVALLFLAHDAVLHEGLWAGFLEHAALLQLRRPAPPAAIARETGSVDLQALVGGPLLPALPPLPEPRQRGRRTGGHAGAGRAARSGRVAPLQRQAEGAPLPHGPECQLDLRPEGSGGAAAGTRPSDAALLNSAWKRLHCHGSAERAGGAATDAAVGAPAAAASDQLRPRDTDAWTASGGSKAGRGAARGEDNPSRCTHPLARGRWRRLFSLLLYVAPPERRVAGHSMFCGHQLRTSVDTTGGYGRFVLVEATLALLGAALADPLNARFALLSGASIPLRPPGLLWAQLMAEGRSRLQTVCPQCVDWKKYAMWLPIMATSHFTQQHWRKGSQWAVLTRPHAALAVADRHVAEVLRR